MIRVALPYHLRTLARVGGEVEVRVEGVVTQRAILDALEASYPMLRGTIRDHVTLQRRPFLRRDMLGRADEQPDSEDDRQEHGNPRQLDDCRRVAGFHGDVVAGADDLRDVMH